MGIHNDTYKVEGNAGEESWQWTVAPRSKGTVYFAVGAGAACWHCCSPFPGVVHPLPTAYDARRRAYTFVGCFCSWSCVKGHNLEVNGGKYVHREICMHIARLMVHTADSVDTGGMDVSARAAPVRTSLEMFGGPLSLEQFRKGSAAPAPAPAPSATPLASGVGKVKSEARAVVQKRGREALGTSNMSLAQLGFVSRRG